MKIVFAVILSVVTETLSQGPPSGAPAGSGERGPDTCLVEANRKVKDMEMQAENFCLARLQLAPGQEDKMKHDTGKKCEAKFDKDDTKGVDRYCVEYPAFCSQIKIPQDVFDGLMKVPVWAMKPCIFSKLVKFKKEMTLTPLKCLVDIIITLYQT